MNGNQQRDCVLAVGGLCALAALAVVWIGAISPASASLSAAFGKVNLIALVMGTACVVLLFMLAYRLMQRAKQTPAAKLPGAAALALVGGRSFFSFLPPCSVSVGC